MKRLAISLLLIAVSVNVAFCASLASTLQLNKGISKTVVNLDVTQGIDLSANYYGKSHIKGAIGEALTDMDYFDRLNYSGTWAQVTPRVKSQGLDHLYISFSKETGLPDDCLIGDTKYGSSSIKVEKNGVVQMSKDWRRQGLLPVIDKYDEIQQKCSAGNYVVQKPLDNLSVDKYPISKESYFYYKDGDSQLYLYIGGDLDSLDIEGQTKVVKEYLLAVAEDKITSRNVVIHTTMEVQEDGQNSFVQRVYKFDDSTNTEIFVSEYKIGSNAVRKILSEDKEVYSKIKGTFSLSDRQMSYLSKRASDEEIMELLDYKKGSSTPALVKKLQRKSSVEAYAKHSAISVAVADVVDIGVQFVRNGYSFDNFNFTELLKTSERAVAITAVYEVKDKIADAVTSRVRNKITQSAVGSIDKPTVEIVTASIDSVLDFVAGYAIDTADIQIRRGKGLINDSVAKKMQARAILVNGVPSAAQLLISLIPAVGPWIGQAANSLLSVGMEFIVPDYDELSISVLNTMMKENPQIIDKWIAERLGE